MKAIIVMFDSLNRHFLQPYGCEWTKTPNFVRLAEKTALFDKAYIGSSPTIPARREMHTGRYNFLHRSWGPLEPFDDSMPLILRQNDVHTSLISDCQHYWEEGGSTYHGSYSTWRFSRGQEGDAWIGIAPTNEDGAKPRRGLGSQDAINRAHIREEADWPQAKTFRKGLKHIRDNHAADNWFLQLETFDPHEPYYTPQKYKDLYPEDYDGEECDWPPYNSVEAAGFSQAKVEHVRCRYAALVSMCDAHLGQVLDLMDELEMWPDTMLMVCTDHGFMLGEKGWMGKMRMPFFEEVSHVPFFIWDPRSGVAGQRRGALVQTIDIAPTLLDFFGREIPPDMQGQPLHEAVAQDKPVREAGLFGMYGKHVYCTDGRYVYMRSTTPGDHPLFNYTLMPTNMRARFSTKDLQNIELAGPLSFTKGCRVVKIPAPSRPGAELEPTTIWDLQEDPKQENPISDSGIEERMKDYLIQLMKANNAPLEQFIRLGLKS